LLRRDLLKGFDRLAKLLKSLKIRSKINGQIVVDFVVLAVNIIRALAPARSLSIR